MNDSEPRETARWAASVTLLLGQLLTDDLALTRLASDECRRSFYSSRLSAKTAALVNELSNFVLVDSVRTLDIGTMTTAGQLIDSIAKHLTQKPSSFMTTWPQLCRCMSVNLTIRWVRSEAGSTHRWGSLTRRASAV